VSFEREIGVGICKLHFCVLYRSTLRIDNGSRDSALIELPEEGRRQEQQ
jgi:hypothetical protein